MKKLAMAMVLLAAVPVVGGCGIDPGPVVTYGKAPQDQRLGQLSTKDLVRPENLRDEVELVKRFLRAAADKSLTQLQTVRSYLVDKDWKPVADELNVYRVLEDPVNNGQRDNTIPVSVLMQRIGVLKGGRLEPVYEERTLMQFTVVDSGYPTGYLLKDPPPGLILTDEMLRSRYQPRPVYFWDNDDKRLVPDLRYIPTTDKLEPEKARLLIEYLYAGPSPFLVKAVKQPVGQGPPRTLVHNNDGSLTIDLPNQLPPDDLDRLSTQLQRTLVGGPVSGIQLKIQGVPVEPSGHPEARDVGPAARFAVQAQKVVRIDGGPERPVPLKAEINTGVEWVAFSRREQSVAMSRVVNGARQFFIGPVSGPQAVTVLSGKPVEQAAWLGGESQAALVLSDHKLYEVAPGAENTKVTQLAGPVPGAVTSFSVVPDGRIALVVDKKFYMAALYRTGEALTITQAQQVPTGLDQVQHVALSRVDAIIAGVGLDEKQTKLVVTQINIDGVYQQPAWADYGVGEQISRLVTDFRSSGSFGATYYDYKGVAQQVGQSGASAVQQSQLAPQPGTSPAPSGSPAATPPPAITAVSFDG